MIFDMDGVLIDSSKFIMDSYNKMLSWHNIYLDKEAIRPYLVQTLKETLSEWKRKYGLDFQFEKFAREYGVIEQKLIRKQATLDKGLVGLLEGLRQKNVPMGVGTASIRRRAIKILNHLGISDYFQSIITADDVIEQKPNPHVYIAAGEGLNIPGGRLIVIDDAGKGITAGHRAGAKCVGKLHEYNDREELKEADLIITNFSELNYEILKNLVSPNIAVGLKGYL